MIDVIEVNDQVEEEPLNGSIEELEFKRQAVEGRKITAAEKLMTL